MIVNFYDDKLPPISLDRERGQAVKRALESGVKWIEINDCMYATSAISSVIDSSAKQLPLETSHLLPPPATLLPEAERQHKLEMIAKMRRDFLKKRQAKRGE